MECDQCGARRPRSGPCPNCGAPPPGTFSSMRQWKDTSRSGEGPAARRGAGDAGRRGSGASWQQQGGWDEGGYEEPPAGRSSGRNRRGGRDYEDVDLERALVPTQGGLLPMDAAGMSVAPGVPMVPGMPQTDEEERALGIRRPAYIPATGERKRKIGSWRVTSGVLSVMLVCIASCALAGLPGKNTLASLFPRFVSSTPTPINVDQSHVPITPVATEGPQGAHVLNVFTTKGQPTAHCELTGLTKASHFVVNDWIGVFADVRGFVKEKTIQSTFIGSSTTLISTCPQ